MGARAGFGTRRAAGRAIARRDLSSTPAGWEPPPGQSGRGRLPGDQRCCGDGDPEPLSPPAGTEVGGRPPRPPRPRPPPLSSPGLPGTAPPSARVLLECGQPRPRTAPPRPAALLSAPSLPRGCALRSGPKKHSAPVRGSRDLRRRGASRASISPARSGRERADGPGKSRLGAGRGIGKYRAGPGKPFPHTPSWDPCLRSPGPAGATFSSDGQADPPITRCLPNSPAYERRSLKKGLLPATPLGRVSPRRRPFPPPGIAAVRAVCEELRGGNGALRAPQP